MHDRTVLLNGVEHANFFKKRATECSKAATRGNWNEVRAAFDWRKAVRAAAAANEDGETADMFGAVRLAAE